ncbi:hypothetical protein QCA50_013754 [Cerrena zonata]|uniref:Uncharacterized protein n=1 Tax=Cerrena zonata TaxID=2478898 RepID=A0AAW0FQD7_9APHY
MLYRRQEVTDTPATISLDSQYVLLQPSSAWGNVSNFACAEETTTNHFTNQVGAYGVFSFVGDRIVLNGIKTPAGGSLQITFGGGSQTFNQNLTSSSATSECAVLFDHNLVNGTHSVQMTLQAQDDTNRNSSTPELHLFDIQYFFPTIEPTVVPNTDTNHGFTSTSNIYLITLPIIFGFSFLLAGTLFAYKTVKRTIFRFRYPG